MQIYIILIYVLSQNINAHIVLIIISICQQNQNQFNCWFDQLRLFIITGQWRSMFVLKTVKSLVSHTWTPVYAKRICIVYGPLQASINETCVLIWKVNGPLDRLCCLLVRVWQWHLTLGACVYMSHRSATSTHTHTHTSHTNVTQVTRFLFELTDCCWGD